VDAQPLRSLEEEFAELEREIAIIRAQPKGRTAQQALMIKRLRHDWEKKAAERKDNPEWQQRIDEKLQSAFEGILERGTQTIDARGKLNLKVDQDALQRQLAPALQSVVDGLSQLLDLKNFLSGVNAPSTTENQEIVKSESTSSDAQIDAPVKSEEPK
jgi:hypothetical protein